MNVQEQFSGLLTSLVCCCDSYPLTAVSLPNSPFSLIGAGPCKCFSFTSQPAVSLFSGGHYGRKWLSFPGSCVHLQSICILVAVSPPLDSVPGTHTHRRQFLGHLPVNGFGRWFFTHQPQPADCGPALAWSTQKTFLPTAPPTMFDSQPWRWALSGLVPSFSTLTQH